MIMYEPETNKGLTEREKEVMDYVRRGMQNKEIADKLCITIYTVKAHISAALHKLNAKNRLDAVLMMVGEKDITNPNIRP